MTTPVGWTLPHELAPVDVTGAVNGWVRTRVGRSHRRELELLTRETEVSGKFSRKPFCFACGRSRTVEN
ncbi:MAG: hypothetical protein H7Z17_20740 [Fuerstia sp.]|nr:hypothetical protein [Fuerstiella sp.]